MENVKDNFMRETPKRLEKFAAGAMTGVQESVLQTSEIRRTQSRPKRLPPVALVTPVQLLGIVAISNHKAWDDMEIVLRQARSFNSETQARTSWLAKATEFQEWFRAERSSLLLADGCITDHSGLVTPMSGFCATLISSLMESKHNTVLFFFAGEHCKLDSPDHRGNGPNSLMRSLISQLLLCSALATPDLTFLSREYLEDLGNYELEALYDLFDNLMQQLPPTSQVYCIIDGISWYEQQRWLYDLERVAAMFEHVARRQRKHPRKLIPLKLLMTSSGKSIELVKRSRDSGSVWKHVSLAAGQAIPGVPRFGV